MGRPLLSLPRHWLLHRLLWQLWMVARLKHTTLSLQLRTRLLVLVLLLLTDSLLLLHALPHRRSGLGWAGGLLSSLSTFVAGRMFVHRDCFFFTIEHASVGHDKHEIVFLGIFNTWIAFEKGPPGKVYFL